MKSPFCPSLWPIHWRRPPIFIWLKKITLKRDSFRESLTTRTWKIHNSNVDRNKIRQQSTVWTCWRVTSFPTHVSMNLFCWMFAIIWLPNCPVIACEWIPFALAKTADGNIYSRSAFWSHLLNLELSVITEHKCTQIPLIKADSFVKN